MRREIQQMIEKLYKQYVNKKRWHKVVMALAAVVVFCTTYALVLPAITLETTCGIEEHTHEAVCYENEDIEGPLVCVLEEHVHTELCYEKIETIVEEATVEEVLEAPEEIEETPAEENNVEDTPLEESTPNESIIEEIVESPQPDETIESTDEIVSEKSSEEELQDTENVENIENTVDVENSDTTEEDIETTEDSKITEDAEESASVDDTANEVETKNIILSETVVSEQIALFGAITNDEGDEITWELIPNASGSYKLKVSGNGDIPDNFIKNVPELAKEDENSTIEEIIIGNGITSIGQYAFYKMPNLVKVDFEEGSLLEVIGGSAFAQCKVLETVALQKCINLKTIEASADGAQANGTFANTALQSIQFPNDMEKIGTNAFYNCNGLTDLCISNVDVIEGAFINCSNLKTVNITNAESIGSHCFYLCNNLISVNLTNITKITPYAFKWIPTLTSVHLNNVNILDTGIFQACPNLTELTIEGPTSLGFWVFENCPNLTFLGNRVECISLGDASFRNSLNNIRVFNYTRDTFPSLNRVATDVFSGNKFEELTIGNLPLNQRLFANSSNLKKVTFETKFNESYDLFTGSTSKFEAIISSKVDEFYDANLRSISPYASSLYFEGPNYLTISHKNGFEANNFPEPLNNLNGNYYADAQGVLYQLNADGTATLIYCPPKLATYTVLTQIPKADGSGIYTVTSVDGHAFALAVDLASLNGKTSKEEAATELNTVLNLVEENRLSVETFANTLLSGEDGGENPDNPDNPGDAQNDYVLPNSGIATKNPISYSTMVGETSVNDVLTITTSDDNISDEDNAFLYLTGESNNTLLTVSPKNVTDIADKIIRIYLTTSAPGLEFQLKTQDAEGTYVYEGHTFKRKDLGNGSYYIDLPVLTGGNTYHFPLNFTYPSPKTPGGTVYLWGAILDKVVANTEAENLKNGTVKISPGEIDSYHKMIWTTSSDEFQVTKASSGTAKLVPSNSEAVVSGLSFEISASRTNEITQQNLGEDFVTTFEYVDIMTLPQGISWRTGILGEQGAISVGNWQLDENKIIVTLSDKTYTLAEYVLTSDGANNVAMESFTVCVNDEDNIEFHWTVKNTKKDTNGNPTETEIPRIKLNIGNDVLIADLNVLGNQTLANVNNQVSLTPHYTYQQTSKTTVATANASVDLGRGEVSLTKTHDRNSGTVYWGEDVNYTVTLKNESVLNASGYGQLVDTLDRYSYIKAENMQEMFEKDSDKKLSIQITNATLYNASTTKTEGIAVDGNTEVILKPQDTGVDVENHYNGMFEDIDDENMLSQGTAEITFKWVGNVLTMEVNDTAQNTESNDLYRTYRIGEGEEFSSIKTALDGIGYTVTDQVLSQYITTWDLSNMELAPGAVLEYELPATVKNTFMLLGRDLENYHYLFNSNPTIINNAVLKNNESEQVLSANTNSKAAEKEIIFTKTAKSGDKALAPDFGVKDGTILDYALNIAHLGNGQYETLPVVDHMQGGNVLLAKVKDNAGAVWATDDLPRETIDGEEYFVLNKIGTYTRVKLGDYWASDVKVTENAVGLDTIIHWYFVNTPKRAYTMTVSYKALVSRDYTKINTETFLLNNEAWLNDHQSHRLHASMNGNGSILTADKKIIVPETGERITYSQLEKNSSTVTYELTLYNHGTTPASVTGADIYDALPNTYNSAEHQTFEWAKGTNVNVSYSTNVAIENANNWTITKISPENGTEADGQYYLCWDKETFKATIPGEQVLTITVTLTFPTTDTEWDRYVAACNGNILQNTFYVYHMSTHVTHDLKGESRAKLQKGVYDIAQRSHAADSMNFVESPYNSTGSRYVYGNRASTANVITYYVVLYNDGTNRLYLNPIVDKLPNGFRFCDMVSSTRIRTYPYNKTSIWLGTYTAILTEVNGWYSCLTEPDNEAVEPRVAKINKDNVHYLKTNVTGTIIEKDNENYKLSFTFAGNDLEDGYHYDSERGQYFLLPGEAIRFGYSVDTNEAKYTEDIATNTIMMPFTDYTGGGLNISSTEIEASDANGLAPNDGVCTKITDAKAASHGFVRNDGDVNNQWLASDVTVTRGEILPGIRKTALKFNANLNDPIEWEIKAYSDGTAPLIDYVITDEIEQPYTFKGDVFFEIYTEGGYANGDEISADYEPITILGSGKDKPIFTIISNEMNTGGSIKLRMSNGTEVDLNNDNNYSAELKTSAYHWNGRTKSYSTYKDNINFTVSFKKNENENQILQILCEPSEEDKYSNFLSIPAGGYAKLKLSTINDSGFYYNKVYNNNAWITPIGEYSDFDANPTHGSLTTLKIGDVQYDSVKSNAIVNVSSGIFTTSEKRVTEVISSDTINTARSTDESNYIVLQDKSSVFRYDLSVTTPKDHTMSKFVLIDNLPQVGDYTTFGTAVERGSEFDVCFAPNPEVSVTITDSDGNVKILNSGQYNIGYSSNTVSKTDETETSFSTTDWDGTSPWESDLSEFRDIPSETITARSIRLVIDDTNVLTQNSTINLSFNAVIKVPTESPDDTVADDKVPNPKPGDIAWNSFGYHYEVNNGSSTPTVLEAAPLPVGIKFPSVPKLVKELWVKDGNAYKTYISNDEETFSFLIYKGQSVKELEGINLSTIEGQTALREKMVNAGIIQYFVQDVTVPAGSGCSEEYQLRPAVWYSYDSATASWTENVAGTEKWQWEEDAMYTVVELPFESTEYEFGFINGATSKSYTFKFKAFEKEEIAAVNTYRTWELILSKIDETDPNTKLADAVFALYTPAQSDAELYTAAAEDIASIKQQMGIVANIANVIEASGEGDGETVTYYLKKIVQTGSEGVYSFDGLTEETYILKELRAPNGYNLDASLHYVNRDADYYVEYTITNEPGYVLPESGGIGVSGLTIGGAALILTAAAGVLINNKKTPKKRKKGGEQ